jgi:hypothetical protein
MDEEEGSELVTYDTAKLMLGALLTDFASCVIVPPIRAKCLRTLQVEGTLRCTDPDCGRAGCLGNRLVPSMKDRGVLRAVLVHHKVGQ